MQTMLKSITPTTLNYISRDGLEEIFKLEEYQLLKAIEGNKVRHVFVKYHEFKYGYECMFEISEREARKLINLYENKQLSMVLDGIIKGLVS